MIRYGSKLKDMIKDSGYTLKQISEKMDIPASTISSWYKSEYPPLEGIVKMCNFFNITLSDFFADELQQNKSLPEYITPQDVDLLKLLNTKIDIKTRIEIKRAFVGTMYMVLQKNKSISNSEEYRKFFKETEETIITKTTIDNVKDMPEFKKLFEESEIETKLRLEKEGLYPKEPFSPEFQKMIDEDMDNMKKMTDNKKS